MLISSLQNSRVKEAVALRERRAREKSGLMLVEGYHELALAVRAEMVPTVVFYCPERLRAEEMEFLVELRTARIPLLEVTLAVLGKLSYRENPDAWLAIAPIPKRHLSELQLPERALVVVAESIEKPGNLGAILRSADAAGADALILCDRATDLYNPNVVRASKGTIFRVPVVEASSAETLDFLRQRGFYIVAATPAGTVEYWDADLQRSVAIAVGTEKEGLSALWMEGADARVTVPMCGAVNSLNVAQALTLLLFEARRQRRMLS
jgi:TrmH family RNA methyltransferase